MHFGGWHMWKKTLFLVLMIFVFLLSACSDAAVEMGPKREVSKYLEKTYEIKDPLELEVEVDSSNIEAYSWDKKQFKIEVKNRIRGVGKRTELVEKLKNFDINIFQNENRINCEIKYKKKIKNAADISSDLILFIPKKVKTVQIKMDIGTVKMLDDLETDLNLETNMVNVDIKRLKGKLNLKGDMGNLRLENGKLKSDSSVSLNLGNIEIKSEYEEGRYEYKTGTGNIDLEISKEASISFENLGTVEANDIKQGDYQTIIKNSTDMGRITIKKY
jgi:hypothetical protein